MRSHPSPWRGIATHEVPCTRMPSDDRARPDREQTDGSLREERSETDRALSEKQAAIELAADQVVDRAREHADAVLQTARTKADDRRDLPTPTVAAHATLATERGVEDEALRIERADADESLRRQRDHNRRALTKLRPLERERTDTYLLTERDRSDVEVANRDDFLSMVSHDLRNLLGGIVLSAEQLSNDASPDAAGNRSQLESARIQRYAARMNRLIGDLVDVASIDAGRLALTTGVGDANALIAEAVDMFGAVASAKGVSLQKELNASPLLAVLDHDRIIQVLGNLVSNAIKFTPKGGQIVVRGERTGSVIRVSVSDTGSGIPTDMLEVVFERFWQVGKNDRRGVGLGLYIAKRIVEAHNGEICAESKRGEGSTFIFTIPGAGSP